MLFADRTRIMMVTRLVVCLMSPYLAGCARLEAPSTKPHARAGLVDQSSAIEHQKASLDGKVWGKQIVLAIVRGEARGGYLVEGVDPGEIARLHLAQVLRSSPNYVIASRNALREVAAERQIQAASARGRDMGSISSAEFIVRVTVTQIERQIRADGTSMEWKFVIGGSERERDRQGAVEVMAEVVEVATARTVYTARGVGLLDEVERQTGTNGLVVRAESGTFRRVTVNDAVRAACIQAAEDIDQFFSS